jgi:hypothetical protein
MIDNNFKFITWKFFSDEPLNDFGTTILAVVVPTSVDSKH